MNERLGRCRGGLGAVGLLLILGWCSASGQATGDGAQRAIASTGSIERAFLPFTPGEKLEYSISYGALHVGHGTMELEAGDSVHGVPTYHAIFRMSGGTLLFRVDDQIESWFDTTDFSTLRFRQHIHEGHYRAARDFEFDPARGEYLKVGDTTYATVAKPVDDASFLYFVRTLSLNVGAEYRFDRYFQLSGNPIILRVLRTDRVKVPAGDFDAVVVQPIIATRGIFSRGGHAEIWLRADSAHEVLQMKSGLAFGSINLYLTKRTRGP